MTQSRQLAAIMFTDIVGYTSLMGGDEQKAMTILNQNRDLHKPVIEKFSGKWIKELGDGVMATFPTASDAVFAAIQIQESCRSQTEFQLRVGIHLGEVIFENEDVFGHGVNVASRIQSMASPECIFISETVKNNIANKKEINTHFVKEEQLKNVDHPVKIFQVLFKGSEKVVIAQSVISMEEKSIAVLPFVNMSSDPEQEYFSDGISEEIINMLAQVHELKVIGRTSSFAFKGKNQDLREIGKLLRARYILEGSVRKGGNKLRITAQLIEASTGFHLYSEKFDRELEDVFVIQDEISEAILEEVKVRLFKEEKKAVFKKYTDNIEAYQYYLKGRFHFNKHDFQLAVEAYHSAIKIDPNYAIASAHLSVCYHDMAFFKINPEQNIVLSKSAAEKAIALDDQNSECQYAMGRLKFWHDWEFDKAAQYLKKAIQLNPNNSDALVQYGRLLLKLGKHEEGSVYLENGDKLDPFSLAGKFYIGTAYLDVGNWDNAYKYANTLITLAPNFHPGYLSLSGFYFLQKKQFDKIIESLKMAVKLNGDIYDYGFLAMAYAFDGDKNKSRILLTKMKDMDGGQGSANFIFGLVHSTLGKWEMALKYYDEAINNREGYMLEFPRHLRFLFPEMREDPRIQRMMDRIGLPY